MFCLIALERILRYRGIVVEDDVARSSHMLFDFPYEILGVVAVGLAALGHDVEDDRYLCLRCFNRLSHAARKQDRDDARVEIAGADHDVVGLRVAIGVEPHIGARVYKYKKNPKRRRVPATASRGLLVVNFLRSLRSSEP